MNLFLQKSTMTAELIVQNLFTKKKEINFLIRFDESFHNIGETEAEQCLYVFSRKAEILIYFRTHFLIEMRNFIELIHSCYI